MNYCTYFSSFSRHYFGKDDSGLVRLTNMDTSDAIVLNGAYRNIDTDKLLVIHEGKEPAGVFKWLSQLVGGALLCLGGLGVIGWRMLGRHRS